MRVHESNPRGCDEWLGSRYCEAPATHVDEVTDQIYCEQHAGPLAWPDRYINLYSLALVTCGYMGMPYHMPAALAATLYPSERAA